MEDSGRPLESWKQAEGLSNVAQEVTGRVKPAELGQGRGVERHRAGGAGPGGNGAPRAEQHRRARWAGRAARGGVPRQGV